MTPPAKSRGKRLYSHLHARLGQAFSVPGGLLFVGVVWALVLYHLEHARNETVQQAEADTINLSVAMSEQVARLVEGADSVKLLGVFRERTRAAIASLPAAASDAVWEKEAHDLIYSAGTLGFVRLVESCRLIQGTIRKGKAPSDAERKGMLDAMAGALGASVIGIDVP